MKRIIQSLSLIIMVGTASAFAQNLPVSGPTPTPAPVSVPTPADLPRIAVYVTGNGVPENEKSALGTRMLASLVNSGRYTGIERSNLFLAEVEKELTKQHSGAVDDGQISELGKMFGVKFVCIAAITPAFGTFQVSARIVNVETAEVAFIGASSSMLQSMDEMTRVADEVVGIMFGGQAREPKPELTPTPAPQPTSQTDPTLGVQERVRAEMEREERERAEKELMEAERMRIRNERAEQQRAERKMQRKERLERTKVKKLKYGVNASRHNVFEEGGDSYSYMIDVGGTGVFFIYKNMQLAPQVNFRFGQYSYYYDHNYYSSHYYWWDGDDDIYGDFYGVNVSLLFQLSTDYRRRIALFAEGGVGFDWLMDDYSSVFNGAIIVGGGVAFWHYVHLDIVKLSIGTTYASIATGLRVVF